MTLQITHHAYIRLTHRVDPTAHAPTLARLAYLNGIPYNHHPFWLKRYIHHMNKKHGKATYKLYQDRLYVYKPSKDNTPALITVMPIEYALRTSRYRGFLKSILS